MMVTAAETLHGNPVAHVPSLRTTLHRLRLLFSGLHSHIRRDARQAALPDPALRPISITLSS